MGKKKASSRTPEGSASRPVLVDAERTPAQPGAAVFGVVGVAAVAAACKFTDLNWLWAWLHKVWGAAAVGGGLLSIFVCVLMLLDQGKLSWLAKYVSALGRHQLILKGVAGLSVLSLVGFSYVEIKQRLADQERKEERRQAMLTPIAAFRSALIQFGSDCAPRWATKRAEAGARGVPSDEPCRERYDRMLDDWVNLTWAMRWYLEEVLASCDVPAGDTTKNCDLRVRACAYLGQHDVMQLSSGPWRGFVNAYAGYQQSGAGESWQALRDTSMTLYDETRRLGCALAIAGQSSVVSRSADSKDTFMVWSNYCKCELLDASCNGKAGARPDPCTEDNKLQWTEWFARGPVPQVATGDVSEPGAP